MYKKIFTIAIAAISMAVSASAQEVPNGSFEEWSSFIGVSMPKGWFTSSVMDPFAQEKPVVKVNDAKDGSAAIRLTASVVDLGGEESDTMPGFAITGKFDMNGGTVGYAYAKRPEKLTFYYKYDPVPGDSFMIAAVLTKYDATLGYGREIGAAFFTGGDKVDGYTLGEAIFEYEGSEMPDTAIVTIFSSMQEYPKLGSVLIVDKVDMAVKGTSGIGEPSSMEVMDAYPNPSDGRLNIPLDLKQPAQVKLEIFDMQGRVIFNRQERLNAGKNLLPLNLQNEGDGMYIYRVSTTDDQKTGRIDIRK